MNETTAIKLGGKHRFQLSDKKNVLSGLVIKDLGDRYLCEIKSIGAYYHIYKDGSIIVYGVGKNIVIDQVNVDGIWLLEVDMTDPITFLFNGMPQDTETYFFVSDMYVDEHLILSKDGKNTVQPFNGDAIDFRFQYGIN